MKTWISFILLFICMAVAFGQNTYYKKGYIVSSHNDTLPGYIERLAESQISLQIHFKKDTLDKEFQVYLPKDLLGFGFNEDSFVFEPVEYAYRRNGTAFSSYRFAKLMIKSCISLYKLQLTVPEQNIIFENNNTFVYIANKEGKYYLLDQVETLEHEKYSLLKRYRSIMEFLFMDCPEVLPKIKKVSFVDEDVVNIFIDYFKCTQPDSTKNICAPVVTSHTGHSRFHHGLEIGLFNAYREHYYPIYGYEFGYRGEYELPYMNEKATVSFGINYATNFLPKDNPKHANMIRIPIMGVYYLSKRAFKPYISLGFSPLVVNGLYLFTIDAAMGCYYKHLRLAANWGFLNGYKSDDIHMFFYTIGYQF